METGPRPAARHRPHPLALIRIAATALILVGSVAVGIAFFSADGDVEADPSIRSITVRLVPDGAADGQVTDARLEEVRFGPARGGGTELDVEGYAISAASTVTLTVPRDSWGGANACGSGMSCAPDPVDGSAWKLASTSFGGGAGEGDENANPAQVVVPRTGDRGYVGRLSRRGGHVSVALPPLHVQVAGAENRPEAMPTSMSTTFSVVIPGGGTFVWAGPQVPIAQDIYSGGKAATTDSQVSWNEHLSWFAPFMAVEAGDEQYQTDWSTPAFVSGTDETQVDRDEQGLFVSGIAWGTTAAAALALIAELRDTDHSIRQPARPASTSPRRTGTPRRHPPPGEEST